MVLESILTPLQIVVENATQTAGPAVVSAVDSIMGNTITLVTLISIILGSPGVIALANYFGKSKERNAGQELLGLLATEVRDIRKDVNAYGTFVYNVLPDEQKKLIDEKGLPALNTVNDKLTNLNEELDKLTPKLAPSARAALRKI